jgi:hypothetical protein
MLGEGATSPLASTRPKAAEVEKSEKSEKSEKKERKAPKAGVPPSSSSSRVKPLLARSAVMSMNMKCVIRALALSTDGVLYAGKGHEERRGEAIR